jgi:hypothetical protein
MAGFPHYYTYRVQVKGTREESDLRAKGVDFIRHMSARGTGGGELPSWERPDVLLGMKDAKRLEGYLRAGWCEDRVTPGGLPKRDRTTSACLEEELAKSRATAATEGVIRRARVQPHQDQVTPEGPPRRDLTAPAGLEGEPKSGRTRAVARRIARQNKVQSQQHTWILGLQKYADDTTVRPRRMPTPDQPEAGEHKPKSRRKEPWTYVQKIRTGAGGTGTELTILFDSRALHTVILHTAAARAALAPTGGRKWVMSLDSGEVEESSCEYSVPMVDCQGNVRVLRARGVGYTIYTKERMVPPTACAVFTEMEGSASRAHQAAGMVDLIIGQGYSTWHPQRVCDSWQTEDNLTLMRSEFPPRYMVRKTIPTKRRA